MDLNNVKFSWISNSPRHWKINRVKHHFNITKNKVENPENIPILSLTLKGIKIRDVTTNQGQLPESYNGYALLKKNDIVFNPMDLNRGWVDRSKLVGLISPSYKVIRPKSEIINVKYYTYFFQRLYTEGIFFPFGEGVHYEYRWGLGNETLKNFPILVPPIKEQEQIVTFLDDKTAKIDDLVAKTTNKIALLKEKRTVLINHCVTKGLNPNVEMKDSGVEWIGEIPSVWSKIRLRNCGDFFGGLSGKSGDDFKQENHPNNKPYIPYTNIYNNTYISKDHFHYVVLEEGESQNRAKKNDLFFLMSSETHQDLGKSCILIDEVDELYLNSFCKGLRLTNNNVYPLFLNYQLLGYTHKELISVEGRGFTRINLRQDKLKDVAILLPPLKEQQQIVDYLDEQTAKIDTTISKEEKRIVLLKEYRQSLISNVVTGKIKVYN